MTRITRLCCLLTVLLCRASLAGPTDILEARAGQYLAQARPGAAEAAMIGSYSVRIYRESALDFVAGAISPRDGEIAGLWLVDLDGDDELEVLVWLRSGGSGSYGRVDRYRLAENTLIRDDPPQPRDDLLTQYMGHDTFALVAGVLQRSFPLYRPGDPNADPTGGSRTLAYCAKDQAWVVAGENPCGK